MAATLLLRTLHLLRLGLLQHHHHHHHIRRPFCNAAAESNRADPDFRKWKGIESEILDDIEPIICLTKDILHSNRYRDGECLTPEDEKAVVDKLLVHHPHYEDKIGCGIDSIMVDRPAQFKGSRCLFVVRTDGEWTDFSYHKCLRAYIRAKYPSYAEKFIQRHYKHGGTGCLNGFWAF